MHESISAVFMNKQKMEGRVLTVNENSVKMGVEFVRPTLSLVLICWRYNTATPDTDVRVDRRAYHSHRSPMANYMCPRRKEIEVNVL